MELPTAKKAGADLYRSTVTESTSKHASKNVAERRSRRLPKWLVWLLLLGICVVAWTFLRGLQGPLQVTVSEVRRSDLETSFTAEAYVRGKEYPLSPQVSGRIEALNVQEGDSVKRGQLLVKLDDSEARAILDQAKAAHLAALAMVTQADSELAAARQTARARLATAQAGLRSAEANRSLVRAGARPQEIAQAQARVDQAGATLDEARKSNERAEALFKQGAIARSSADAAQARFLSAQADLKQTQQGLSLVKAGARPDELRAAQARVDAARGDIDLARAASREIDSRVAAVSATHAKVKEAESAVLRAKAAIAMFEVRAPDDGVISRLIGEFGTQAIPGVAVLTLSSRRDLRIDAEISTEDAAKARVGMQVRVTSPAYPGRSFTAKISSLSPVGELKPDAAIRTRIVRARVLLDRDWDLFRPGMELDVEGDSVMKEALVAPADAITFNGPATAVWVVDPAGRAHSRLVEVGFTSATQAEILSGLKAGERVVVDGKDGLQEGQEVQAKT